MIVGLYIDLLLQIICDIILNFLSIIRKSISPTYSQHVIGRVVTVMVIGLGCQFGYPSSIPADTNEELKNIFLVIEINF